MPTRVAINGFGRIGRAVLRAAIERDADIRIVAVNDATDRDTLAALLTRDSVYGRFPGTVGTHHGFLDVNGHGIMASAIADPANLPWAAYDVDVAIEATGRFRTRAQVAKHLQAGAKKVILAAPMQGAEPADANLVLGVNDDVYDPERDHIVTNLSCTTNCLALMAKVLHTRVGIRHGAMTTIHAYTADQNLIDAPHTDLRRARAAALSLVPTSTGAAQAIGLVIPELAGRLQGYAVRVPTPTGSIVDLTVEVERPTSLAEVNGSFAGYADRGTYTGILAYSEEPIVSADIVKSPYSAILDAPLTAVVDETQVKVVAWYDNEWGYANRLVELASRVMAGVPLAV